MAARRMHWDDTKASDQRASEIRDWLHSRFEIDFGPVDPAEDYFLGANRTTSANLCRASLKRRSKT